MEIGEGAFRRWVSGAAFLLAAAASLGAQSARVNGELPRDLFTHLGSLAATAFSDDGQWAVYATSGPRRLFSAPADGGGVRDLLGALQPDESPISFAVASQTGRVVFRARRANVLELYSAALDGSGAPTRLDAGLGPVGVLHFAVSPDGAWVVYVGERADGVQGLYRVPVGGGASLELALETATSGAFSLAPVVGPDGARVFFGLGSDGLHAVPLDGSAPPTALGPAAQTVASLHVTPDSARVVCAVGAAGELWSAPSDGSAPAARLHPALAGGRSVALFELDPTGARVVFVANPNASTRWDLFSAPVDASAPAVNLHPGMLSTWDVEDEDLDFTPDGSTVVYGLDKGSSVELWRAATAGGSRALVSATAMFEAEVELDPSGARVVYRATVAGQAALWSAPLDGSAAPVRLDGPLVAGGSVLSFAVGAQRVAYVADQETDGVFELWSRALDGGGVAMEIGHALGDGEDVDDDLRVDPAGERVLYGADTLADLQPVPYLATLAGGAPLALWASLSSGPTVGDVSRYAWSSDGAQILYVADEEEDEAHALFAVGPGGARSTLFRPEPGERVARFALEPATQRVVLLHERPGAELVPPIGALYGVPRGGGAALRLDANSAAELTAEFALAAGGRVVFRRVTAATGGTPSDEYPSLFAIHAGGAPLPATLHHEPFVSVQTFAVDTQGERAAMVVGDPLAPLRSAPLDGSSAAVSIGRGTNPGATVEGLALHGASVVYVADELTDGVRELWTTPIDGSAAPLLLSPPLAGARDVDGDFVLSPDGERALFRCDLGADELYNLFSVPTAGGPSVRVAGVLPAFADVAPLLSTHVRISPDGELVLYLADARADEVLEAFLAPIDGSIPPRPAHAAFPSFADVAPSGARFSPDGALVVYVADAATDGVFELFAVPTTGGASVRLSGPMPAGGGLFLDANGARDSLAFESDGEHALYLAEQESDGVVELWSVPLDGSRAPWRRSGDLVLGGDVKSFAAGPERQVLYLADELQDEVLELFLSRLPSSPTRPTRGVSAPGGLPGRVVPAY